MQLFINSIGADTRWNNSSCCDYIYRGLRPIHTQYTCNVYNVRKQTFVQCAQIYSACIYRLKSMNAQRNVRVQLLTSYVRLHCITLRMPV